MTRSRLLPPAFALLLSLLPLPLPGSPSLQALRAFSASRVAPGSVVKVELQVHASPGEDLPEAWIAEEAWPASCQVIAAFWEMRPCSPVQRPQGYSWLFGYPGEEWTVAEGTLTYLLQTPSLLPEGEETQELAVQGTAHTWEASTPIQGESTLLLDPQAPLLESPLFLITMQPGWNLVSLPAAMEANTLRELAGQATVYLCRTENGSGLFHQGFIPNAPGQPFWIREEGDTPRQVLLMAQEPPESLLTPAGRWRRGWNLVGVSGNNPIPLQGTPPLWQWNEDAYAPRTPTPLRPGEAAWLRR